MSKKLLSNFIYQLTYQITIIILPIISIPIVSHALGAEGIGIFNYITSIVTYFILFAGLGLSNYGVREIASVQNNKYELSKKFWELEYFNLIIASIVILIYLLFIFFLPNKLLFLISGISLFATLFDITWFYQGIQNFKQITIINMLIKILSFIFIIVCVKGSNDLYIFFIIQSTSVLASNCFLFLFLRKKVIFVKVKISDVLSHFLPALNYFIGKISITLYTTLNKTLLGVLYTTTSVGLYTNSLQLITILVTLIGTLDMVLMPYMTKLVSEKSEIQMIRIMENTIDLQFFFSIPLCFGLILINNDLIPWFFGDSFLYLKNTVPILAPLIVIMPLGTSIVRQYLLPSNRIRQFNISVISAAIIGILINVTFIPKIGIWGAIIATIASETIVTLLRLIDLKRNTTFNFRFFNISTYFFSSILMLIVTKIMTQNMLSNFITTLIQCSVGFLIYMILTSLMKSNVILNYFKKNN